MASKVVRHKEHIHEIQGKRILKSGLIFGANASGKSNLIKAVEFSRRIITNGLEDVDTEKKHFRITKENYKFPGVFQFDILIKDVTYSYGFAVSYQKKEIVAEWLIKHYKTKESYVFNREVDEQGRHIISSEVDIRSIEDKKRFEVYLNDFRDNQNLKLKKSLILTELAERSGSGKGVFQSILDVFNWFKSMIIIFPNSKYRGLNDLISDPKRKGNFLNMLSFFDTGIEGLSENIIEYDKILGKLPDKEAEDFRVMVSNRIPDTPITVGIGNEIFTLRKDGSGKIIAKKLLLNHGNEEDLFDSEDESDGTKRLFDLIPLFMLKDQNRVILIDEIDRSLHTKLTYRFLEIFYEIARDKATQLIATTHDSSLLDLDLIRQDEIWFVEREQDKSSKLYSLDKFKQRFDKKIEKDYLIGRYGGIPIFTEELLEMEDQHGDQ